MAQKIYYQWQDDDASFDFNTNQLLASSPAGRYHGFDFGGGVVSSLPFAGGLILGAHTTGIDFPTKDNVTLRTPKLSVLRTQQGETITENSPITITIDPNASGLPRIDLIVCEHEYIDSIIGGAAATYLPILGTPNANPVAPSVIDAERQTIIGTLYVPNGAGGAITTISATDWTAANVPNFANDATIPHTNLANVFEQPQTVTGLLTSQNTIKLTTVTNGIEYTLDFGQGGANPIANDYFVFGVTSGSTPVAYAKVLGIAPDYAINNAISVTLYSVHNLQFVSFGNNGLFLTQGDSDVYVRAGTPILLQKGSLFGAWEVIVGGQVSTNAAAKMRAILSSGFEDKVVNNSYQLALSSLGNQLLITDASFQQIEFVSSTDYTLDSFERGTQITIHANEDYGLRFITQLGLSMGQAAPPAGYKRILNPNGYDITIREGGSVTLVETETHWKVISIEGEQPTWYNTTNSINAVKVARIGTQIFFDFPIQIHTSGTGAISANSGTIILSMPVTKQYPNEGYVFGLPRVDNPKQIHLITGTNNGNYSFGMGILGGSTAGDEINLRLDYHPAIANNDVVWWLTEGVFFRTKN